MLDADWPEIWWQSITGPRSVVNSIADALRDAKQVVLAIPNDLPWRHEMRLAVASEIQSTAGNVSIKKVDASDMVAEGQAPGEFLLERYALRSSRLSYRAGRLTIQDYLIRERVLANTLVWVKGLGRDGYADWIEFCCGYNASSVADGAFVIEAAGIDEAPPSNFEHIDYEALVGRYDAQLYNSLVLSGEGFAGYSDAWKRYIATALTNLCGADVEVATELLQSANLKEENLIDLLSDLACSPGFARRGARDESSHPFALCRCGNTDELKRKLWDAQVEVLFPLIESERLTILDALADQLVLLLADGYVEQFGGTVAGVDDIELGTLTYLMGSGQLDVPDRNLRERIFLLRDCRNKLAHRECCDQESVARLLG